MSLVVLPRLDVSFLAEERFGATSLSAVGGVWAVVAALVAAIVAVIAVNRRACRRCARPWIPAPTHRCCRFSASPASSALAPSSPPYRLSPSCATGCCRSGWPAGLAGGRDQRAVGAHRLGLGRSDDRARCAGCDLYAPCRGAGIDPALLHRVAVISAGTLDSLPQNGAVVTLLAVCGSTHRESYFDIVWPHRRPDHRVRRSDRARLGIRLILRASNDFPWRRCAARALASRPTAMPPVQWAHR